MGVWAHGRAVLTVPAAQLYGGNHQGKGTAGGIWVRRWWAAGLLCLLEALKCCVCFRKELVTHYWLDGEWAVSDWGGCNLFAFRAWAYVEIVTLCVSVAICLKKLWKCCLVFLQCYHGWFLSTGEKLRSTRCLVLQSRSGRQDPGFPGLQDWLGSCGPFLSSCVRKKNCSMLLNILKMCFKCLALILAVVLSIFFVLFCFKMPKVWIIRTEGAGQGIRHYISRRSWKE